MADPAKLERLQQALAAYASGECEPLFDERAEQLEAKVRQRALRLLDQRARSKYELQQRLLALEFAPAAVANVIADLERVGLLDDAEFAIEWVRQRAHRRGKSRMVLNLELKEKGVPQELRDAALEQISLSDERHTAQRFASKKAQSVAKAPENRAEYERHLRRILGVLARRGFPQGLSLQVAREALDQRIEELG